MWIGSGSDSGRPAPAKSIELFRQGALGRFADDERGSYTLWSLIWFMLYAAFGGLAVDVTDAYRNQTLLQSTADAAAMAAIMSVGEPGEDPVAEANAYSTKNMRSDVNGDVLTDSDITFGSWSFADRSFTAGATPVNAVHVVTRRAVDNGNPVAMNFLRILALFGFNPIWNVAAESIAVGAVSTCHNNGLIAGGMVTQTNQNDFYEKICVHGVQGQDLRQGDTFESGVSMSTTCYGCLGPSGLDPHQLEGFTEAWSRGGENDPLFPLNALVVDDYVAALRGLPDTGTFSNMLSTYGAEYANWQYLFAAGVTAPLRLKVTTLPDVLVPYTIYEVDCNGTINLPQTPIRNVGIVSTCRVQVPSNDNQLDMQDVVIAVDGDFSNPGIKISGGGKIGHPSCKYGAVELYTNGSPIHFAASGNVNNVRLISGDDITWAAKANGRVGIMAEAVGDIQLTTQSDFGLCPSRIVNGPNQYTYRLVL